MNYNLQRFPHVDRQQPIYKKNQLPKGKMLLWILNVFGFELPPPPPVPSFLKRTWSEWIIPEMAKQTAPPRTYSNCN